jgi:hypothetical protein
MPRVIVQFADVTCWNTEDVQGADEFYMAGSVTAALGNQHIIKPVITRPIAINDNQTKQFNLPAIFDAEVPESWYLNFGLSAIDEDSSKDWSKIEQANRSIIQATEAGLAYAAPIAITVLESLKWFINKDQDDVLGYHRTDWYPVRSFQHGWQLQSWRFSGGSNFYSNWNYQVRYWVGKW